VRKKPPTKKAGQAKGSRRRNGFVLDMASAAQFAGWTENAMRARVERGRVPYRRDGGRIIFIRDEIEDFLRKLPGVNVKEALTNDRVARDDKGKKAEMQP
jgi:hypothetical protein